MQGSKFSGALLAAALTFPAFAQQTQAPQFTISTAAGNGTTGFSGNGGPAINTGTLPSGVAADAAGNFFVADTQNERVLKITPTGIITTLGGNGAVGFSGDGGPATKATLNSPGRVATDVAGNVYFNDYYNHRLRKIALDGTITTVAGNGGTADSGDGGSATAAGVATPEDLVLDSAGNLFFTEDSNRIRMVTPAGIISTIAGTGSAGFSGDGGPAIDATINIPRGIAVNAAGDLFIADQLNERIRKISGGIITTVAGTGPTGFSGDGGPAIQARLNGPAGICLDAQGNIYISDRDNNRIRMLATNGLIWTVAGNGTPSFSGDGGASTNAAIYSPHSVASGGAGIYIADYGNSRVRLLTPVHQAPAISPGGVVSASAFGGFSAVAAGSFIEIYGSNLATDARGWGGADFNGVNAPTSLDGTSVTIGGQPAFVSYISPAQVDALVPSTVPTGSQQVVVTNAAGMSAPFTVTVLALQPELLAPSSFAVNGTQYAVAFNSDGTYALPAGAITGIASHPASPGDTIILYGTGFGPVTPSIPAGQLVQLVNTLASDLQLSVGGVAAMASYAGLAPNLTGVYQFNIVVPNVGSGSAVPLTFTLGGVNGTQTLNIAVQ